MRDQAGVWRDRLYEAITPQDLADERFPQFHSYRLTGADGALLRPSHANIVAVETAPAVALKVLMHYELMDHTGIDGGEGVGQTQDCQIAPFGSVEELLHIELVLLTVVLFQDLASDLEDTLTRVAHIECDFIDNLLLHRHGEDISEL
jgi:hypothetical protein